MEIQPPVSTSSAKIAAESEENVSRGELCMRSLGIFEIAFYCPCEKCCGKGSKGITATGTKATVGRTIAVDPSVIPYGTKVVIDGVAYTAEDTGGAINGKRIDILCESHQDAINRGVIEREVFIIE